MPRSSFTRSALLVLVAALAVGCAEVPRAPKDRDAAAKTFPQVPGKAGLYVFRHPFWASLTDIDPITLVVFVDGRPLGGLQGRTFLYTLLEPGAHTIVSHPADSSRLAATAQLLVSAEPGKNVFVAQELFNLEGGYGANLRLADEAWGQRGVDRCELVESP